MMYHVSQERHLEIKREGRTRKIIECIICEKCIDPLTLSKDALRNEGKPWLLKGLGEGNLSDVGHFNMPPYMWRLMGKYVDNNGRKKLIIARNLWL